MFKDEELSEAVGVPLFYGVAEAIVLGIYCITVWKLGWTKAPPDESFCVVISKSYEVEITQIHDLNAIEVVIGSPKEGFPDDLLFELDHSTASINDSERESGSIYLSYPTPPRKQETRKKTADNLNTESVLFPVIGSPEIELGLSDIELNVVRKKDDFQNFLMETSSQRDEDIEEGGSTFKTAIKTVLFPPVNEDIEMGKNHTDSAPYNTETGFEKETHNISTYCPTASPNNNSELSQMEEKKISSTSPQDENLSSPSFPSQEISNKKTENQLEN